MPRPSSALGMRDEPSSLEEGPLTGRIVDIEGGGMRSNESFEPSPSSFSFPPGKTACFGLVKR